MTKKLTELMATLLLTAMFSGCAITPRVSTWNAPNRFNAREIFNASLQAGQAQGMQMTASDRESGTVSFRRTVGDTEMILSVTVKEVGGQVQVGTTVSSGGGSALAGMHEEFIKNFHVFLFRNLGINTPEEHKNIEVQKIK